MTSSEPVEALSYTEASRELDEIVAFFEGREVDVDQLVERLERATAIVDELDRRIRRTRAQVEQLVPRLRGVGGEEQREPDGGAAERGPVGGGPAEIAAEPSADDPDEVDPGSGDGSGLLFEDL